MAEKALAFIDLLGFGNMITKDRGIATSILNDFYNITYELIKANASIEGKLFSDSLLAYSNDRAALVNMCCQLYRKCLEKNGTYIYPKSEYFLLPRGGISIGVTDIRTRTEAPNLTKNFIVSPALVHSAGIEKAIKGSRLLVAIKVGSNEEKELEWNDQIKTILYENDTYIVWPEYRYCDALWFADTGKDKELQEKEIISLLSIACDLLMAAKGEKNIEQQSGTVRIGLLSYSRFFSANMTEEYISNWINQFSDEKYWRIWLAMFEMGLQSPDSFAFPNRQDVFRFYKRISLTKAWKKVIDEIHRPGNEYMKCLFDKFIEELEPINE